MKFLYFCFPCEIFYKSFINKISALGKIYSDEIFMQMRTSCRAGFTNTAPNGYHQRLDIEKRIALF